MDKAKNDILDDDKFRSNRISTQGFDPEQDNEASQVVLMADV